MATKERSFKVEFQDLPKMEDITKDQEKKIHTKKDNIGQKMRDRQTDEIKRIVERRMYT